MQKRHYVSLLVAAISIALIAGVAMKINNHYHHQARAANTYSPPTSIAANCSSDATSALNAWFASLPADSVVNLPDNSCYLVSNSPASLFIVQNSKGLTINGNGTTLEQTAYAGNNESQPVLTLGANNDLTVNDLTVKGPSSNSGDTQEGDAGIIMWQNNTVLLNALTITSVDGDGLDVYPLSNDPGVNWNVTVDNSTLENIGYHAIVPEAADGFTFENSTVTSGNIDAEVDFACDTPQFANDCGTPTNPAIGVQNMTYNNDSFPNGMELLDGMSCMPIGNWTVENNNFGNGGMVLEFNTTYSLSLQAFNFCGQSSGLTVQNNTSTGTSQNPCCGSGSPYIVLQGWKNVNISNNHLVYDVNQGLIGGPVVDLWSDSNVMIANNTFGNYYNITAAEAPAGWPANVAITTCGNTTGPVATPSKGAACATTTKAPPPSTPTGLKVTNNSPTSVSLSWSASTDTGGPGLGGYYIYRNGTLIGYVASSSLTYTDNSVTAGSTYSYTVEAFDNSTPTRIASPASAIVTDTTLKVVVVPPTAPTQVTAKASSSTSVAVSWTASTDGSGPGLKGYFITRNGVTLNPYLPVQTTSYTDTSATGGQSYAYKVQAQDVSGNFSAVSSASSTVTTPLPTDTTPPTQPTKLVATTVNASQINLSWTASTDDVGVANYTVWRSSGTASAIKIATVTTTSYGNTNLSASTKYNYYVVAVDAAGNSSKPSTTVSAATNASTPTAILAGVVDNASGKPLANVHVQTGTHGSAAGMVSAYTNSSGVYVLTNLSPSAVHVITYSLAGFKTVAYGADYSPTFYVHNVTLDTSATILAGIVKNTAGKPLANVYVHSGGLGSTTGMVSTHTNSAGGYVLLNLSPSIIHVITYSLNGYTSLLYTTDYPTGVYVHNVTLN